MAIPRAQLVIYPRAGHGFIYQHAELVAAHVNMFLDGLGNGPQHLTHLPSPRKSWLESPLGELVSGRLCP